MTFKQRRAGVLLVFLCFILSPPCPAERPPLRILPPPSPSHPKPATVFLQLAEKIPFELSDAEYLVAPESLVVDRLGDLYIYDARFPAVFKLTVQNKKLAVIARPGQGPGEFGQKGPHSGRASMKLFIGPGDRLFVADPVNRKILVFANSGELEREHPVLRCSRYRGDFYPLADEKNRFYIPSAQDGVLDVFAPLKDGWEKIFTYLKEDDYAAMFGFAYHGFFDLEELYRMLPVFKPREDNLFYSRVPPDRLLIYVRNSSMLYVFRDRSLVKSLSLIPAGVLGRWQTVVQSEKKKHDAIYRKMKQAGRGERAKQGFFYYPPFHGFFPDADRPEFFYLEEYYVVSEDETPRLFQFDAEGRLLVSLMPGPGAGGEVQSFKAKRNQRFYAVGKSHIMIFRR